MFPPSVPRPYQAAMGGWSMPAAVAKDCNGRTDTFKVLGPWEQLHRLGCLCQMLPRIRALGGCRLLYIDLQHPTGGVRMPKAFLGFRESLPRGEHGDCLIPWQYLGLGTRWSNKRRPSAMSRMLPYGKAKLRRRQASDHSRDSKLRLTFRDTVREQVQYLRRYQVPKSLASSTTTEKKPIC